MNYGQRQAGPFALPQQQQQQPFPGFGVQFQVPNYNQLFNQQAQFQNQLLNNFNQLSNQFINAFTGGYPGQQQQPGRPPCAGGNCGYQPPHNGGNGFPRPPITQRPHPPPVPAPTPNPGPVDQGGDNVDSLINEIFTRPPTDAESGADLIDIRVDENEKTRRKRQTAATETQQVGVDNRFGLGEIVLSLFQYNHALHKLALNLKIIPIG